IIAIQVARGEGRNRVACFRHIFNLRAARRRVDRRCIVHAIELDGRERFFRVNRAVVRRHA
ncbi:hypothetical protein ABMY13_24585, partial [Vibrio vulnificus]|uniref:hypothetical protein n=1 Tax=Vibrio vulnificus TaxID=672 RepID=UPI0040599E3C